jgi:hypothetical protein
MVTSAIWTYRDQSELDGRDLSGYQVEAIDGEIGKIDELINADDGAGYIIVDTGPWIFGRKVMLPAGVISGVDHDHEQVHVNRTKEQIKASPPFEPNLYGDDVYRQLLGSYYGPGGVGWHGW